jgi:hypothetical protein
MIGRIAACAGLFALSALLVAQWSESATAQTPKEKREVVLEKQVKALQQDLEQAAKLNAALKQDVNELKTANNRLQASLKKEKNDGDDKTIKSLQTSLDGFRGAGVIHVVVLKAKSDTPSSETQLLIDEAYAQLTKIKGVRGLWAGKPAAKATPDASADYTVALVLVFDDAAGVKTYLNDPIHVKFADKHLSKWETPVVYDFEPRKPKP